MLVLGVEGEAFWSGLSNRKTSFPSIRISQTSPSAAPAWSNKWDVDIAARFGVAVNRRWSTARLAGFGAASIGTTKTPGSPLNPAVPLVFSERASKTLDGLLVGFGVEYAFANNWTAKFEYGLSRLCCQRRAVHLDSFSARPDNNPTRRLSAPTSTSSSSA